MTESMRRLWRIEVGSSVVNYDISENIKTRVCVVFNMLTYCFILKYCSKWMNSFEQLTGALVNFALYKDKNIAKNTKVLYFCLKSK